jgi:hypothetical protein
MVKIPFPATNGPGNRPQDGSGRLINVFVEDRQNQQGFVWRRVPGANSFLLAKSGALTATGSSTVQFVGDNV